MPGAQPPVNQPSIDPQVRQPIVPSNPDVAPSPNQPIAANQPAPPGPAAPRKVWEGHLMWGERAHPDQQKRIQCEISCSRESQGVAVNAQQWPDQLVVKFIPQTLLQKLKEFFTNSIWMTFNFSQLCKTCKTKENRV